MSRKTTDVLNIDKKDEGIQIKSSTVRRRLIADGRKVRRPVKILLLIKAIE